MIFEDGYAHKTYFSSRKTRAEKEKEKVDKETSERSTISREVKNREIKHNGGPCQKWKRFFEYHKISVPD